MVYYNFVILNPTGSVVYGFNQFAAAQDYDVDPVTGNIMVIIATQSAQTLVRLLPSGDHDYSFSSSGTQNLAQKSFIRQLSNGKLILVTGSNYKIYKLNNNGTVDNTFPNFTSSFRNPHLMPGNKILYVEGNSLLHKIDENGVVDNNFNANTQNVYVQGIADVQPTGKILCIKGYGGLPSRIARLNDDGTDDTGFETKYFTGNPTNVFSLRYGKIFVSGDFSKYDDVDERGTVLLLGEDYYNLVGNNKFDSDYNGCTASDINFPFLKYEISDANGTNQQFADTSGSYNIAMTTGSHTVTPKMENPTYYNISPSSVSVSFPGGANPQTQDFCIVPNGNHQDIEVVVVPMNAARPGSVAKYKVIYKNKGNMVVSGQIVMAYPQSTMTLTSSVPTATSTANQLTTNYTNLLPFESREQLLSFTLNAPTGNPPLNIGNILDMSASISPTTADETPSDNTFALHQNVVNSYDPNDKTCLEGTTISDTYVGNYVHYLIRFENTGNAKAINITVKDDIDMTKFDISSLIPLSGSHPFTTKIEGNHVRFIFKDINLETDDANNDGYVLFKIKLASGLQSGDLFANQAEIYFDYNFPISTDYATTLLEQNLAVQAFVDSSFNIFPNPARDLVTIDSGVRISKIEIYSIDGRLIKSILSPEQHTVDVSTLTKGVYMINVNTEKGQRSQKLIKN